MERWSNPMAAMSICNNMKVGAMFSHILIRNVFSHYIYIAKERERERVSTTWPAMWAKLICDSIMKLSLRLLIMYYEKLFTKII